MSNCPYKLTDKKTGIKHFPFTWERYYELVGNKDENLELYHRCYVSPASAKTYDWSISPLKHSEMTEAYGQSNKFWVACADYAKLEGRISHVGIPINTPFIGARLLLKNIGNHAAMIGDKSTWDKTRELDRAFHCFDPDMYHMKPSGSAYQLALPAPKNL